MRRLIAAVANDCFGLVAVLRDSLRFLGRGYLLC